MSQETLDFARYGFYVLTVVLGILLLARIIRNRNQSVGEGAASEQAQSVQTKTVQTKTVQTMTVHARTVPAKTVQPKTVHAKATPANEAIPSFEALSKTPTAISRSLSGSRAQEYAPSEHVPPNRSLAAALAGIRLPPHWHPDRPNQISNPIRLTSTTDTPAQMATAIADELDRLGFTVKGTGARSAVATKESDCLDIEIIPNSSSVTTQIALSKAGSG